MQTCSGHHLMQIIVVCVCVYTHTYTQTYIHIKLGWQCPLPFYELSHVSNELLHVQFSHSAVFDSLQPHGLQHARPSCPSPTPGACSKSGPSSQWCHPTVYVVPLSCNSHIIKLTCLKYTILIFSVFPGLCSHHHSQFYVIFIIPRRNSIPVNCHSPYPPNLPAPSNHWSPFVSIDLPVLDIPY